MRDSELDRESSDEEQYTAKRRKVAANKNLQPLLENGFTSLYEGESLLSVQLRARLCEAVTKDIETRFVTESFFFN